MGDIISAASLLVQLIDSLPETVRKIAAWKLTKQEVRDGIKDQEQDIAKLSNQLHKLQEWTDQLRGMSNDLNIDVIKANVDSSFQKLEQFRASVGSLKGQLQSKWNKIFPSLLSKKLDKLQQDQAQLLSDVQKIVTILNRQQDRIHALCLSHSDTTQSFRPVWHLVPRNPPGLYFDFKSTDMDGVPLTPEGKLREAIFSADNHGSIGAIAKGQGGVGKTCAVCELGRLRETRERFPGGVYFGKLGAEANISMLIVLIAKFVKFSGSALRANEILLMKNLDEVVFSAADWFQNEQCLFIFDDVWAVGGIPSNVIDILSNIAVHPRSQIMFSTRDSNMHAATNILFEERAHFGEEAHKMIQTASNLTFPSGTSAQASYKEILKKCSGLPIALRLAGSAVRSLAEGRCRAQPEDAWEQYEKNEKTATKHKHVMMGILLKSLEFIVVDTGDQIYQERFESLCVLQNNQQIPISVAARLWNTTETDADETIYLFERFSVVRVYNRYKDQFVTSIGLHDILLEIAREISTRKKLWAFYTERMLESYLPVTSAGSSETINSSFQSLQVMVSADFDPRSPRRDLSSTVSYNRSTSRLGRLKHCWLSINDDGYIFENLFNLLVASSRQEDILWLLSRPQWIIAQLSTNGLSQVELDISTGIKVLHDCNPMSEDGKVRHVKWLEIIKHVVRESYIFIQRSSWKGMPWFQLYGRLQYIDDQFFMKSFLSELEEYGPKPWPRPSIGCLPPPDGKLKDTIYCEHSIFCQSLQETSVLLIYHANHKVYVDEYCRVTQSLKAREVLMEDILSPEIIGVLMSNSGKVAVIQTNRGALFFQQKEENGNEDEPYDSGVLTSVELGGAQWYVTLRQLKRFRTIMSISDTGSFSVTTIAGDAVVGSFMKKDWGLVDLGYNWTDVIYSVISGDGGMAAFTTASGTMILFRRNVGNDDRDWEKCYEMALENIRLSEMVFSNDGLHLVCGFSEGHVFSWEYDGAIWTFSKLLGHDDSVCSLDVCTSSASITGRSRVISGSFDKTVRIWDRGAIGGDWTSIVLIEHDHWVSHVSLNTDARFALTASKDTTVRLWDLDGESYVDEHQHGHSHWVLDVAVGTSGEQVVSCSRDRTVRVWSKLKEKGGGWIGTVLGRFEAVVWSVAMSGDETVLLAGVDSMRVHVYRRHMSQDWKHCEELTGITSPVLSIRACHCGRRFVCACASGGVVLWECHDEGSTDGTRNKLWKSKELHRCGTYSTNFPSVEISNDGETVFGGIDRGEIHVWKKDGSEWYEKIILSGHSAAVLSLSVSGDCTRMVSASRDGTVVVWDLNEPYFWKQQVLESSTDFYLNCEVSLSKDGERITARGNAQYSKSWILSNDTWTCVSPKPYTEKEHNGILSCTRPVDEDLHFATRARNIYATNYGYVLQLGRAPFLTFVNVDG